MIREENIYYELSSTLLDRVKGFLKKNEKLEMEMKVSKWLVWEIVMMRIHPMLLQD